MNSKKALGENNTNGFLSTHSDGRHSRNLNKKKKMQMLEILAEIIAMDISRKIEEQND
jgi:hypothetical protein